MADPTGARDEPEDPKERLEADRPYGEPGDQAGRLGKRDPLNALLDEALPELERIEKSLRRS